MYTNLDNWLLELILMDTIAIACDLPLPGAEQVIQHFLPIGIYDQIIARYDTLSEDGDDNDPCLLQPWLCKAARKDSRWKHRMIVQFLCIMRTGGAIGPEGWAKVAALAAAMGASRECRQILGYLRPNRVTTFSTRQTRIPPCNS